MSDSSGHSCEICAEFVLYDRTACNSSYTWIKKETMQASLIKPSTLTYEVTPLKTTSAGPVI